MQRSSRWEAINRRRQPQVLVTAARRHGRSRSYRVEGMRLPPWQCPATCGTAGDVRRHNGHSRSRHLLLGCRGQLHCRRPGRVASQPSVAVHPERAADVGHVQDHRAVRARCRGGRIAGVAAAGAQPGGRDRARAGPRPMRASRSTPPHRSSLGCTDRLSRHRSRDFLIAVVTVETIRGRSSSKTPRSSCCSAQCI